MGRYSIGRLRKTMVVIFTCLSGFSVSKGLVSIIDSGFGVGNVVGAFFPTVVCLVSLLFFARPDLFPLGLRSRKIGLKEGLLTLFIGLLIAFSPLIDVQSLTRLLVLLLALIGLLATLYLIATSDDVWGIIAFLFTIPFLSYVQWEIPFLQPGYGDFITVSYVSLLLVMAVAAGRILKDRVGLVRTSLDKYVLAFIIILLLSSITSPDPSKSFKMFFQLVIMILTFYLVSNHIHTKKDFMLMVETLVFFEVFQCFMYGYFHLKGVEFSFMGLIEDRGGAILMPRAPQVLLGLTPISISLSIVYSSRSMKKVYYILATLVFLSFILITQTRTFLVTLAIGAPMILFYRRDKRWLLVGLIVAIFAILASGTSELFFQRHKELMSLEGWERALSMRLDGWRAALGMMRDHPFTGVGLGMWEEFIHLYGTPFKWVIEGQRIYVYITSAHQAYLQYGAEAGVGAFLLSLLIMLKAQLTTFSAIKRAKDDDIHTIAVGLAWTCIGSLIWGIYSSPRGYVDYAIESWGLLAIIIAMDRVAKEHTHLNQVTTNINRTKGKKLI